MSWTNIATLLVGLALVSCRRPPVREPPPLPPEPMFNSTPATPRLAKTAMCVRGAFVPKGLPFPLGSPIGTAPDAPDGRAAAIVRAACSVSEAIAACDSAATERAGHRLKGTARFDLSIGPEAAAVVTKSVPFELEAELGDCIASALAKATFPKEAVGSARYELKLRPNVVVKMAELGTNVDGLRPEFVKRVLRAQFAKFRVCYEPLMKHLGPTNGWVDFTITLRKNGTVSALNVDRSKSFNDQPMLTCMANVITPLMFEPIDNETGYIDYQLGFSTDYE